MFIVGSGVTLGIAVKLLNFIFLFLPPIIVKISNFTKELVFVIVFL